MKRTIKLLALLMTLALVIGMFAACKPKKQEGPEAAAKKEYTYNSYTSSLGSNWNPHTWENNGDQAIAGYLEMPFVTMQVLDSKNGIYQWVYEMATAITDVTSTHQADLTKYGSTLPNGVTDVKDVTSGYVFEIKLNPNAKWQNGDVINADSYIYSMEKLLNSKMRNYRANLYYAGESALAGGAGYFNSEAPIYLPVVPAYGEEETPDYSLDLSKYKIYLDFNTTGMTLSSYSFKEFKDDYGFIYDDYKKDFIEAENGAYIWDEEAGEYVKVAEGQTGTHNYDYVLVDGEKVQTVFGATYYAELSETTNPYGYIEVTAENKEKVIYLMDQYLSAFGMSIYQMDFIEAENGEYVWDAEAEEYVEVEEGQVGTHTYDFVLVDGKKVVDDNLYREFLFYFTETYGDKVEWDTVGLYKVDDYTINYVCQTAIDINYFLTSCTSTWLVHPATYEASMKEEGGLTITKYGTSKETSMSYGPYMMESFQDAKQVVFVQNPNWYGWQKDADGNLVSYTNYKVDGKNVQRYQTTKIVIDVYTADVAYQKFLKGELMDYAPTPEELVEYTLSDRLTRVDETYTMSFFFNTDLDVLKALDEGANENSVVLSNYNFRKAFSLAFNRADFVTVTEGYTPEYSLMNKLYHYDIYNDPTSSYRASAPAMQAICNLYGVEYGEDKIYKTLEEAYKSITGYNLEEAKKLMKTACEELVAANLYTAGAPITIQIGWKKGAMEAPDNAQVAKVQEYLNAAIAGSGFGAVTIEGIGNLEDRYGDVPAGKLAIGYGAWGGAAFYPFRNMQVYCDTVQYKGQINETGCWDPATTELKLTVNGVEDTMTWEEWSRSMIGTGKYASADNETKLKITAAMEEEFLKFYYRIPLCGTTVCSLLSYKADYYTWDYNIMYGFGGLELLTYNYTDAEWADYVASQGGTLNYK